MNILSSEILNYKTEFFMPYLTMVTFYEEKIDAAIRFMIATFRILQYWGHARLKYQRHNFVYNWNVF